MKKAMSFSDKLAKLKYLKSVNFPVEGESSIEDRKQIDEYILKLSCNQSLPEHLAPFRKSGEITKLIHLLKDRLTELDKILGNDKVLIALFPEEYFLFCPDAFALTYQMSDTDYFVAMSTPILAALYSGDMGWTSFDDIAIFIDSILVHELAHCYSTMKHDATFNKKMKEFCKKLGLKPTI